MRPVKAGREGVNPGAVAGLARSAVGYLKWDMSILLALLAHIFFLRKIRLTATDLPYHVMSNVVS